MKNNTNNITATKKKKGHRAGIRARICEEPMIWHGFRLRRGDIFGTHKGIEIVFTGKTRPAKRRDGTTYGVQALIFTHAHVYAWEADQSVSRADWEAQWVDCGSGVGQKFWSKYRTARKDGILPGADFVSNEPATSGFYFKSDKSRYDYAAKKSYYYDCMTERRG